MSDALEIAHLRSTYARARLDDEHVRADPIDQFQAWFAEALEAEVAEPNACTLATVTAEGQPAARIVLLKGVDAGGFAFFTNYGSRKARELDARPHAALVFWWIELERQVRVEGTTRRVSDSESDAYFAGRPRGSQLGAWASPQSEPVSSRTELEARLADVVQRFGEGEVPRPPHWGGYRIEPTSIEFWQGRPDRLHDRLRYAREPEGWRLERLAP